MSYPQKFTAAFQQRRETVLQAALAEGRISSNSYQSWAQRFDADPDATEQLIARLYPVATQEPVQGPTHGGTTAAAYPQEWLTQAERDRINGVPHGGRILSD